VPSNAEGYSARKTTRAASDRSVTWRVRWIGRWMVLRPSGCGSHAKAHQVDDSSAASTLTSCRVCARPCLHRRSLFDDIVVIDGGSTDGTVEYVLEVRPDCCFQIRPGLAFRHIRRRPSLKTRLRHRVQPDGNCKVEQLSRIVALLHQATTKSSSPATSACDIRGRPSDLGLGNWFFSHS